MSDLETIWFDQKTPSGYDKHLNSNASGVIDEKIIVNFFNNYLQKSKKTLIDLGIGTGRELNWIDKLTEIKKIVGLDYSPVMLRYCKKHAQNLTHKIKLVQDNLLNLLLLPKIIKGEKNPAIYISLLNSLGNFEKKERIVILKNIRILMKGSDRIVLALYKKSQYVKIADSLKDCSYLQTKNKSSQTILNKLIEYGSVPCLWTSIMTKYRQIPRFSYDKTNNIVVHLNGKIIFTSHRFDKKEIKKELKTAGLRTDKIIEGKAMWIVVGKK